MRSGALISRQRFRLLFLLIVFCLSAVAVSTAQTLTTLADFNGANGSDPSAGLVLGTDGDFYGTTYSGGANGNLGTVFKITPAGTLSTLYSFSGGTDGENPDAGLVQGTDGNFYGTTRYGGDLACNEGIGCGTVFKITPTGTLSTLYSFSGSTDGANPAAGFVQATDGNFYGTTEAGGANGFGTVFKITPTGALSTLYSFCVESGCLDGRYPVARLIQATDGIFYGTTLTGGTSDYGTVFSITPTGTLTTLYSFCSQPNCTDGSYPEAGLVQVTDGNFYGTTHGGDGNSVGTVFVITPTGSLTTLYSFCSQPNCADGAYPYDGLLQATDGNFYGTTYGSGGVRNGGGGTSGTAFAITPTGTLTTLYSFCSQPNCADGAYPGAGVVQGTDGNFYGTTTAGGGTNSDGTVFSLSANSYTLTVTISGRSDSGTVTSTDGSIHCPVACSSLYLAGARVTLNANPASGWTFVGWTGACTGMGQCNVTMTQSQSVTATFSQQTYLLTVSSSGSGTINSTDNDINCPGTCGNSYPANAPVTLNAAATQGWTFAGWGGACSDTGSCMVAMTQNQSVTARFTEDSGYSTLSVSIRGSGTVVSTDEFIGCPGTCSHTYPPGGQSVTLFAFANSGATFSGWSGACTGTDTCTVNISQDLSVTATFSGQQQEIVTHSFGGQGDGQIPLASLVADSDGNLYGTTSAGGAYNKGTVFKQTADGAESVLHSFGDPNGNDGRVPYGNLVLDSANNLYGTTSAGGVYGKGTVFEISPNGTETVLYNFAGGGDGQNPRAGLIFVGGNLYGTTVDGGTFNYGTAFALSPNGGGGWMETVLYSFGNGDTDGRNPYAALVSDGAGNLYGTTTYGGADNNAGTAFELSPFTPGIGCCREIQVYTFGGDGDGANPFGTLILDASNNLYGTTAYGGLHGDGIAFELSPNGIGCCRETPLYNFGEVDHDGKNPVAGLLSDGSGNYFGTTQYGGANDAGTVFELQPAGIGCCRESPLYSFGNGNGNDGLNPSAALIFASGYLYGTTARGGASGFGTLFAIVPGPLPEQFMPIQPCRVVDTRGPSGPFGGPSISGGTARSFPLEQGGNPCNLPSNIVAYSLNVTVVPHRTLGYLTIWPTGGSRPVVSTLNSLDGRIKANAAIVPAGTSSGSVSVYVTDTTDVILDIDGYFTAPGTDTLQFYALTPCRVADTREPKLPQGLGTPHLSAGIARDFPVLDSSCIPTGLHATAYSLNVTAVPYPSLSHPLGYLEVWPTDQQPQNPVSTLNNLTGTYVANAAIVPAGTAGKITALGSNDTDLVIDINGYFAAPGPNGFSFYSLTPCRVSDSRINNGPPFTGTVTVNTVGSSCAPPSTAGGYVFNATVVPNGSLGYLTLWPDSEIQPVVSTLNAADGWITSNMAIVPNIDGSTDAYAFGYTHLILDIAGYFAP